MNNFDWMEMFQTSVGVSLAYILLGWVVMLAARFEKNSDYRKAKRDNGFSIVYGGLLAFIITLIAIWIVKC